MIVISSPLFLLSRHQRHAPAPVVVCPVAYTEEFIRLETKFARLVGQARRAVSIGDHADALTLVSQARQIPQRVLGRA